MLYILRVGVPICTQHNTPVTRVNGPSRHVNDACPNAGKPTHISSFVAYKNYNVLALPLWLLYTSLYAFNIIVIYSCIPLPGKNVVQTHNQPWRIYRICPPARRGRPHYTILLPLYLWRASWKVLCLLHGINAKICICT